MITVKNIFKINYKVKSIAITFYLLKEIFYSAIVNENSAKSPVKVTAVSTLPAKSPRKSPVSKNIASENNVQDNKENGEFETYNMRSKLHRLGKLYSGK